MHQGGRWTHKQPGKEIWVYDLATRQQVRRIKVGEASYSIAVTPDDSPLLFSFGAENPVLSVYDATTYECKGSKEGIGDVPPSAMLYLPAG